MDGDCGIRQRRTRFLVAGVVAAFATLVISEPALAQFPLDSQPTGDAPASGVVGTVTQALPTAQVGSRQHSRARLSRRQPSPVGAGRGAGRRSL